MPYDLGDAFEIFGLKKQDNNQNRCYCFKHRAFTHSILISDYINNGINV